MTKDNVFATVTEWQKDREEYINYMPPNSIPGA